jgi:hypothetical protein
MIVVFPEPVGPMKKTNSPFSMKALAPSNEGRVARG